MGLTASYKSPGRNDPCPCGSGRKYKKCCFLKPDKSGYNPREKERILDRLNEVIEKYHGYAAWFDKRIVPRLEQARNEDVVNREVVNMIMEAAYFEGKIGSKRIALLAVETLGKSDLDKEALTRLVKESRYEWIEVRGVVLGAKIVATSLWDGRELTIYEQSGTYQARVGTLLATRLIPCESDWQMTGHATLLPEQIGYQYKRTKELGVTPPPLTQTEHVDALIGYGKKNKVEEEMEEEVAQANAKINPNMRPGPDETMLTTQMLSEAAKLDLPPVKRVRDEIINEFCESWLDSPQKELGNMTPREMILSERRERGNPIKKIKYEIETRYGGDPRDEIYNEGLWHQQQGQFWEALWFYAQIVNYAKELPEPHRFYANVAASLAYLTCYKEARLLFEKHSN